ncbi:hypothetical protein [Reichenbachiella sp. MALMAid0571]|uniref:hypothetical protein n=1 Tax=Reichenbachiella sp. MALMAid0571 TaxID=3143939 RepID=UPI0032E03E42
MLYNPQTSQCRPLDLDNLFNGLLASENHYKSQRDSFSYTYEKKELHSKNNSYRPTSQSYQLNYDSYHEKFAATIQSMISTRPYTTATNLNVISTTIDMPATRNMPFFNHQIL